MKKKKIKNNCRDCEHRYIITEKNWQWCNIPNQYNWKGKCKYFKKIN